MLSFPLETTLQVAAHRSDPPCFVRHLGMRLGDFEAKLPRVPRGMGPFGQAFLSLSAPLGHAAARDLPKRSNRPQAALLPLEHPRALASFGSKSRRDKW